MSARFAPTYQRRLQPRGLLIGAATLMCLMILATPVKAQSKKTTSLPPVRYQVQLWTVSGATVQQVFDTNNQLQTVGSCLVDLDSDGVDDSQHGFLYVPAITPGVGVDLNDIVDGIPNGWTIRRASAISESGLQIAAHIGFGESLFPSNELQAVVIDMNPLIPVLHLIPDRAFTGYSYSGDINDGGDVVVTYRRENGTYGHYLYNVYNSNPPTEISGVEMTPDNHQPAKINNNGVIVGHRNSNDGYRRSAFGLFEEFPGLRPTAINENGAFCGGATVTTTKPRGTANYAFVYDTSLTLNKFSSSAGDLNKSLDSVLFGGSWLNHRTFGNLTIINLLDPRDSDSSLVSSLFCNTMTDRDPDPSLLVTNFPALGGTANIGGIDMGMHLIPVPAP